MRDSTVKCCHTKQLKAQSLCEAVRHVEVDLILFILFVHSCMLRLHHLD